MNLVAPDVDIKEAMSKLETSLITPLVSGELDSWVKNAQHAAADLAPKLTRFIEVVLRSEYDQIAKTDSELLRRVQQMVVEDEKLMADFESFRRDLDTLAERVPLVENDEAKTKEHRARVEAKGTALVLAIKKHQTAADTWLSEALNRDNGVGD